MPADVLGKRSGGSPTATEKTASGRASEKERPKPAFGRFRAMLRNSSLLVERTIDIGTGIFSIAMKILGPCLICLAHGLISFVAYTYFMYALPLMESSAGPAGNLATTLLGLFIATNLLYNYWHAICLDGGRTPEWKEEAAVEEGDEDKPRAQAIIEDMLFLQPANDKKQCMRCNRVKPQRAHHCSVCRRCVLKMDHHCPWINNCVGHGNYRHFCLFMLFLFLGCSFILVVFFNHFPGIVLHMRRGVGTRAARQNINMAFMLCSSIVVAISILGGFHVYLVLTNQTTIEFQTNMMRRKEARRNGEYFRNPYDLGRSRNFQQVFGPNRVLKFMWMFPYLALAPTGDGIEFRSLRARVV